MTGKPRGGGWLNNYGSSAGIGISKPTIMNCIIKIILPCVAGGGFYNDGSGSGGLASPPLI